PLFLPLPMSFECDILFALLGDVRRNSRALRQLRTLTQAGFAVHAITLGDAAEASDLLPGVRLHVIPTPTVRGPRFFSNAHQLVLRRAASISARAYHASDLYVLPALARQARRKNARLVYDSRELYSGLGSTRRKPWASAYWYLLERRFIQRTRLVITVNES